jgi:opacity protein-like surface antigen
VAILLLAVGQPCRLHGLNFAGMGVNFANDLDVKVSATPTRGPSSGTFDVETGFRLSTGYDFKVNDYFSAELETGFIYNDINDESIPDFGAWYGQVPLLVNLVVRYPFESGWTPFAGIGGGVSVGILDLSFRQFTPEDKVVEESGVKLKPAWQILGGLQYRLNENWALSFVYKYLETGGPKITVADETFKLSTVHNHFFGLQVNYFF